MDEGVVDLAAADLAGRGTDPEMLERASRHHLLDLLDVPGAGVFAPLSLQERLAVLERRSDRGRVEEAFFEPRPEVEPTPAADPAPIEAGPVPPTGSDTAMTPLIATLDALRSEVVALREVMMALRAELAQLVPRPQTQDVAADPSPAATTAPGPAPAEGAGVAAPPAPLPAAMAEPVHPRPTTRRRWRGLYVVLLILLVVSLGLLLAGGIILALVVGGSALPRAWPALPPEVSLVF